MKKLLARLTPRRAIGVAIGDHEIVASYVALTPMGPVELGRRSEAAAPEVLEAALERLLPEASDSKRRRLRPMLFLGLPALRLIQTSRPIAGNGRVRPPQAILAESIQSPTIVADDLTFDSMQGSLGKKPVLSLVSCRRKYLSGLLEVIAGRDVRMIRAEPAPCALLRLGERALRTPAGARTVVRVFLGATQGLAVLTSGPLPLFWRTFPLTAGEARGAIRSAARTLRMQAATSGLEAPLDAMVIHGRPDLGPLEEAAADCERSRRADGPNLDLGTIAFAVATAGPNPGLTFNLAQELGPPPSILDIFPWGETAVQVALLFCASLYLTSHADGVDRELAAVRAEAAKHGWLKKAGESELTQEKKSLEQKIESVQTFLGSRILWTHYVRDLSENLPAGVQINNIQAVNEFGGKGGGSRSSLVMNLSAPIPDGQSMPREIDTFLDALRGNPNVKRDFPTIEMSDLRRSQIGDEAQQATCNVMCLPKAATKGKGKPKAEDH